MKKRILPIKAGRGSTRSYLPNVFEELSTIQAEELKSIVLTGKFTGKTTVKSFNFHVPKDLLENLDK